MKPLKSTIAEKIKKLNFFIPLLQDENAKPVSQLDIDMMLEILKDLYLDMLTLNESIVKERLADLVSIPVMDTTTESTHIKETENDFVQNEKTINIQSEKPLQESLKTFENKKEGNSIEMTFESEMLEASKEEQKISRKLEETNTQTIFENIDSTAKNKNIQSNQEVENLVDKVKSYVKDVLRKEVTTESKFVDNKTNVENDNKNFEPQEVSEMTQEEMMKNLETSSPQSSWNESEIIEKKEDSLARESVASKEETPKEISVQEYLKAMRTDDVTKNVTTRFESSASKSQTIADKFSPEKESVFEKISSHSNTQNINFKLQQQAVSDLRNIIGLNERFLFIQKLFLGDAAAYTEFISQLNTSRTLEEMGAYLLKGNQERSWEENAPEVYFTLLKLVGRKFV